MKTLVNLTAILTETQWPDPQRSALAALHHELSPGLFIHIGLGSAGLQIYQNAERAVAIPLEELVKLARAHETRLGADTIAPIAPIVRAAPAVGPRPPGAPPSAIGNPQSAI